MSPEFVEWARGSLVPVASFAAGELRDDVGDDLERLRRMIGAAPIVALGETHHGAAQLLDFRNRLFRCLVEEQGFTAIALESGIVEGRVVHDYVRGAGGELDQVLARGISWCMDSLPQNRELVQWMREYNERSPDGRHINFYGFDVPGSPNNPHAKRGHDTALLTTLDYLESVDPEACAAFRERFGASVDRLQFGIRFGKSERGYHHLSQAERDGTTAAIADLIALFERMEAAYVAAGGAEDYDWAYRAALAARQLDNWLRQVPKSWSAIGSWNELSREQIDFVGRSADVRDRAQADNLEWIIRKEGAHGKILIFAERTHLATSPVDWLPNGAGYRRQVAGTYLRRRLGNRLVTIGSLVGEGEVRAGNFEEKLPRANASSTDGLGTTIGTAAFLLDLRSAPASIREWLREPRRVAHCPQYRKIALADAFDILLYVDSVTPALRS